MKVVVVLSKSDKSHAGVYQAPEQNQQQLYDCKSTTM